MKFEHQIQNICMPIMEAMHETVKLSKYKRRKIPAEIRRDLYLKIVVPAFAKYSRALVREYKKLK